MKHVVADSSYQVTAAVCVCACVCVCMYVCVKTIKEKSAESLFYKQNIVDGHT